MVSTAMEICVMCPVTCCVGWVYILSLKSYVAISKCEVSYNCCLSYIEICVM
jgi:hypothetical protein